MTGKITSILKLRKAKETLGKIQEEVVSQSPMAKGNIAKHPSRMKARANLVADISFLLTAVAGAAYAFKDTYPWLAPVAHIAAQAPALAPVLAGGVFMYLRYVNIASSAKTGLFDYTGDDDEGDSPGAAR